MSTKQIITAFIKDDKTPATGISPTIRIRLVSDSSLVITDDPMTELGDGMYKYSFAGYDPSIEYAIRCDAGLIVGLSNRYSFVSTENDYTTELSYLRDITDGRWKIVSNQMIFYKSDNITEVARFNLFDSTGNPSEINVFDRQRV
jgi:hypothetical protein